MSDLGVPQRFLDLAKQVRGPRALSEAGLRERFGEPADVEIHVGQVWRARWDEVSVLMLVLTVAGREVQAAPVTIDPPAEDAHSLVVDGSSTVFGVDATVWAGLADTIPVRVLDCLVDVWTADLVRLATDAAQGRPATVPVAARHGRAIRSELDLAALVRAELADDLESLVQAPGLPVETPGQVPRDLASLLGDRLNLPSLCSSLGLRQPEVMKLLRGKTPLTPDQVQVISQVTDLSAEEVGETVRRLPLELVATAEHPRWRPTWTQRAQHLHIGEADARLSGSYGVFALAARETGGGEPDWDERLRQYFHDDENRPDGA